jgi:hypothetical protein
VQIEAVKARSDKRLLVDGGGVYQELGAVEASGRTQRKGKSES